MASLLTLLGRLHSGRKQYLTAATMFLLGVGVLTGQVDPDRVTVDLKPVTFENVDEKLNDTEHSSQHPGSSSNTNNLLGLLALLQGLNSAANRAAIAKTNATRTAVESK